MVHPIIPSLAVAAIGLIGARLGDALRHPIFARDCRKSSSPVVWRYDGEAYTAAVSKPRKTAKRVVSSSPR
jgi:hypothetical protein